MSHALGVWSDATDGYDVDYDFPDAYLDVGYAAVYHENGPDWSGPTDFYRTDFRAPLLPQETKTWSPIHLWADPQYYGLPDMYLAVEMDAGYMPPDDRDYYVELLHVPDGISNAPDVGTTWLIPRDRTLVVQVPTYETYNGLESYQFAVVAGAVPEPAALLLLAAGAWLVGRRRA